LIELLELIGEVTGRPVRWQTVPPRAGDVRDSQADLERARTVLAYQPCVSLAEGLRATWEWFNPRSTPVRATPVRGLAPAVASWSDRRS